MDNITLDIIIVTLSGMFVIIVLKLNRYINNRARIKKISRGILIKKYTKKLKRKQDIYSLELGKQISGGGFFIGIGSIDEELKYYFYVDKDGGKQISSINVEVCVLIEGNGKPRLEIYEYVENENWTIDNSVLLEETKAYLYVPKNTIKKKFNGNL